MPLALDHAQHMKHGAGEDTEAHKAQPPALLLIHSYPGAKAQRIAAEKAEVAARAIKDKAQAAEEVAKAACEAAVAKSREACAGFDMLPIM